MKCHEKRCSLNASVGSSAAFFLQRELTFKLHKIFQLIYFCTQESAYKLVFLGIQLISLLAM